MQKPKPMKGLHHVAIYVTNLSACVDFYTQLLGMKIIWQPDDDNVYLTSGSDNFALHRAKQVIPKESPQKLDHIGFFLESPDEVDEWHDYLKQNNVDIKAAPKNHRDSTRSF